MKTRSLTVWFIPIVAICGWAMPLAGQAAIDEQLPLAVPQPLGVIDFGIQAQRQQEAAARRLRGDAEYYLAIRIDEMKRVCKLSDRQVKTFEVAAKGAVQRYLEKWQQRMQPIQVQVAENPFVAQFGNVANVEIDIPADAVEAEAAVDGNAQDVEPEPDAHPPAEAVVVFQADGVALQAQGFALPGRRIWRAAVANHADVSAIADEPVWAKTIDRVLTEEQRQAMHQGTADRIAYRRQAAVSSIVSQIDDDLLLSAEQRGKLAQLVTELAGDRSEVPELAVRQVANQIPMARLEGVLSDAQLAKWDDVKVRLNDPARQRLAFPNGGFFRVEDAVLPPAAPRE